MFPVFLCSCYFFLFVKILLSISFPRPTYIYPQATHTCIFFFYHFFQNFILKVIWLFYIKKSDVFTFLHEFKLGQNFVLWQILGPMLPGGHCLAPCCQEDTVRPHVARMTQLSPMLPGGHCLAPCCQEDTVQPHVARRTLLGPMLPGWHSSAPCCQEDTAWPMLRGGHCSAPCCQEDTAQPHVTRRTLLGPFCQEDTARPHVARRTLHEFTDLKYETFPHLPYSPNLSLAQSAWAVEYTDCISAQGQDPPPNECPRYDTKQYDGEVPVMLEFWGMLSTPSLPLLPGSLWPGVVAPDWVLSMGQIELNCVLMLNWIAWNRTVLTFKLCTYAKLNCCKWNYFWHWNCTYAKLNCLK